MKAPKSIYILIAIFVFMFTLPAIGSYSPLDDPVERYNHNYKQGRYKIDINYDKRDINIDDNINDIVYSSDIQHLYNLTFQYNIKKGLKLKINKRWIPTTYQVEYSRFGINDNSTHSSNSLGADIIYKPTPQSHEYYFSINIKENKIDDNNYTSTRNILQNQRNYTFAYKPDISQGGFGFSFEFLNNIRTLIEDDYSKHKREEDIYRINLSYEGQI